MLLSCKDVCKAFSDNVVLEKVSFIVNENEKVAIIGVNGAGKTTLFKIITNQMEKDSGELVFNKDLTFGYLSQSHGLNDDNTVFSEMEEVFSFVLETEKKLRDVEVLLKTAEGENLKTLLSQYDRLTYLFETNKGYEYKSRIKGVIKGLGFLDSDSDKLIKNFSGGQKTRLALAKLLLKEPDMLLLDEPTNHLDINAIAWLEDFLKNYEKSVVIISHDRYFLDKIVTKVLEIEHSKLISFNGNYSDYAVKKEIIRENLRNAYDNQQREIKRQEEVIKLLKSFNREKTVKRANSREKLLAKTERLEKPDKLPASMRLALSPKKESGNDVLTVTSLKKSFGSLELFDDLNFNIYKGEKVALIGDNGTGKTTLFRIILNEINADIGTVRLGSNVVLGYYDQEHKNIDLEKSVFDNISDAYPTLTVLEIRNALAAFMFTGDFVFNPVKTLSGGERGRVALAKIMLSGANFLVLDEPTNHLDIASRSVLEDVLTNYDGTILYISHDRYFINNTATKIIALENKNINFYYGNYDYYIEKSKEEQPLQETKKTKEDFIKNKQAAQNDKKTAKNLLKLEKEIEKIQARIEEIDLKMNDTTLSSNYEELNKLLCEKDELENTLLSLYEAVL